MKNLFLFAAVLVISIAASSSAGAQTTMTWTVD